MVYSYLSFIFQLDDNYRYSVDGKIASHDVDCKSSLIIFSITLITTIILEEIAFPSF